MVVFASFFRLWLWLRFLPLLIASTVQGADRAVQSVAYPFLFNWGFLAIAAYNLHRLAGDTPRAKGLRRLAWFATILAVAHLPYSAVVLNLLEGTPTAVQVFSMDLPALLLLLGLYRSAGRGVPR